MLAYFFFRVWLERFPTLMAAGVYTYLRIIIDHGSPAFTNLRNREVEFCVSLLRDKVKLVLFIFFIININLILNKIVAFFLIFLFPL